MKPRSRPARVLLTYLTDFSRVGRVLVMDPAPILRHGQIVTTVGGAVYAQR